MTIIIGKRNKKLKKALEITCELMNDSIIYGIDADTLWSKIMEMDGYVSPRNLEKFILKNIDRFSDDDAKRRKAIKKLGW
jgi:hypothetical protein